MVSSIYYKYILFDQSNLTPICCEPTLKTHHNLWNKINANAKSIYSNLRVGSRGYLGVMLTDEQYDIILNKTSIYPTHPGPLIIPEGTTSHMNSNIRVAHTKEVHLFCEVTRFKQALLQQIVATFKEAYLADIRNCTNSFISNTMSDVLTQLQDNYGRLMPYELLKREEIVKKTTYHPREPTATLFSDVK